ncbi:MAG: hypothetical protein JWN20_1590 [Jatrophihabitantaceae bacterium]|nr:hypothetical protein [Jatrophihabitantaceae bacterium]
MPDDDSLLRRLIGDDPSAPAAVAARARTAIWPPLLVAAALLAADAELLAKAGEYAATTRDRQLVVLAAAYLRGNAELLDALVRDHLSEHPDNLLAAWIAGRPLPDAIHDPPAQSAPQRAVPKELP